MTGLECLDSLACVYLVLSVGIRASGWGDDVGFRVGQCWCDLHMDAWDPELPRVGGLGAGCRHSRGPSRCVCEILG